VEFKNLLKLRCCEASFLCEAFSFVPAAALLLQDYKNMNDECLEVLQISFGEYRRNVQDNGVNFKKW
jgi:hypothetical protein